MLAPLAQALEQRNPTLAGNRLKELEQAGPLPQPLVPAKAALEKKPVTEADLVQVERAVDEAVKTEISHSERPVPSVRNGFLVLVLAVTSFGGWSLWAYALGGEQQRRAGTEADIQTVAREIKDAEADYSNHLVEVTRLEGELASLKTQLARLEALDYDTEVPVALNPKAGLERFRATVRQTSGLVCFAFDFDGFRRIRPTFGDQAVDEIMVTAGERIKASLRETDWVVHVPMSDEFQVFCLGTRVEECFTRIRSIHQAIARQPFLTNRGEIAITLSGGVAVWAETEGMAACRSLVRELPENLDEWPSEAKLALKEHLAELITKAERYAYQAKANGKDAVYGAEGKLS